MRYIGYELKNRMDMLGIDVFALSEMTFMDEDIIRDIIADTHYFIDGEVRNKDLLVSTMNRGEDSVKYKNVKAKIQDFMNDFVFVNEILLEEAE